MRHGEGLTAAAAAVVCELVWLFLKHKGDVEMAALDALLGYRPCQGGGGARTEWLGVF